MNGTRLQFLKYKDEKGNDPVWDFLKGEMTKAEIGRFVSRMEAVMEHYPMVSGNILENLGKGLHVLRMPNSPNNPRVFMCPHPNVRRSFVILHAYRKKGDKIPESEKRIAMKRQKEVQDQPNEYIF